MTVYWWFASAGTWRLQEEASPRYDMLADAFLAGQLHLTIAPDPRLLALPDPYDPRQNRNFALGDATFYKGKYYLYFGPVPGVLHAAWKGLTGRPCSAAVVGLLLGVGGCACFWGIARRILDLAFPTVSAAKAWIIAAAYALGGLGPFLQARPGIYHEAILSGTFFTLLGLFLWLAADSWDSGALWRLAMAGLAFGLAAGSRLPATAYGVGVGIVLVSDLARSSGRRRFAVGRFLAFSLPLFAVGSLLLLYNYARFESFLEFGTRYQIAEPEAIITFDRRSVPYNLSAYFGFLPQLTPYFPFQLSTNGWASARSDAPGFSWIREASSCSVLLIAPLVLFLPVALRLLAPSWRHRAPAVRRFVAVGFLSSLCVAGAILLVRWAAMRYTQDVLPVAMLLAATGWWSVIPGRGGGRSRLLGLMLGTATVTACGIGSAFGLTMALNELCIREPQRCLRMAYQTDAAMARLLRAWAPSAWPSTYLSPGTKYRAFGEDGNLDFPYRPLGVFYPDGADLPVPNGYDSPVDGLEVESLADIPITVRLGVNGHDVGQYTLQPGWQLLTLSTALQADATRHLVVRLSPVDANPAGHDAPLWPIRIRLAYPLNPRATLY